ncbi:MAG: hypothetical protein P4L99_18240 [Chthoniobacter sp.]|nr:hypothetical protein [Chthoniobacter sp.]
MMRRFLLSFVLAMCVVVTARAEQDLYNPLAVGLRWDVDVDVKTLSGETLHGTAVREVTGTETVNNHLYFVVLTSFTGLPTMKDTTMYRRKTARGVFAFSSLDTAKQEYLEAVLPLVVGQTWKTVVAGQPMTTTVEGKEAMTVGDKKYENCMKISYKASSGIVSGIYYQAPDVGNVLETTTVAGSVYTFTLKKFSGLK